MWYCAFFAKANKSENFTPGFVCVLHTFGRSLQWNPHIHVILSEGATGNISVWRPFKHFNYTFLRNAFRTALLNQLEKKIGKRKFKKTKAFIYKECTDGFYVRAKPSTLNPKDVAKYIGRYLGRPVIATSRITAYDGKFVTFWYCRHEDNVKVVEKIPAAEFIKKLIIHIPDKHFKMVRYYGIYAKHHKNSDKLIRLIRNPYKSFLIHSSNWRIRILTSFGYDPLRCKCGHYYTPLEIVLKGSLLIEKYRKYLYDP